MWLRAETDHTLSAILWWWLLLLWWWLLLVLRWRMHCRELACWRSTSSVWRRLHRSTTNTIVLLLLLHLRMLWCTWMVWCTWMLWRTWMLWLLLHVCMLWIHLLWPCALRW
jgi:hypothetical protein